MMVVMVAGAVPLAVISVVRAAVMFVLNWNRRFMSAS